MTPFGPPKINPFEIPLEEALQYSEESIKASELEWKRIQDEAKQAAELEAVKKENKLGKYALDEKVVDALDEIFQNRLGRSVGKAGAEHFSKDYDTLISEGLTHEEALSNIDTSVSRSSEGAEYNEWTPDYFDPDGRHQEAGTPRPYNWTDDIGKFQQSETFVDAEGNEHHFTAPYIGMFDDEGNISYGENAYLENALDWQNYQYGQQIGLGIGAPGNEWWGWQTQNDTRYYMSEEGGNLPFHEADAKAKATAARDIGLNPAPIAFKEQGAAGYGRPLKATFGDDFTVNNVFAIRDPDAPLTNTGTESGATFNWNQDPSAIGGFRIEGMNPEATNYINLNTLGKDVEGLHGVNPFSPYGQGGDLPPGYTNVDVELFTLPPGDDDKINLVSGPIDPLNQDIILENPELYYDTRNPNRDRPIDFNDPGLLIDSPKTTPKTTPPPTGFQPIQYIGGQGNNVTITPPPQKSKTAKEQQLRIEPIPQSYSLGGKNYQKVGPQSSLTFIPGAPKSTVKKVELQIPGSYK